MTQQTFYNGREVKYQTACLATIEMPIRNISLTVLSVGRSLFYFSIFSYASSFQIFYEFFTLLFLSSDKERAKSCNRLGESISILSCYFGRRETGRNRQNVVECSWRKGMNLKWKESNHKKYISHCTWNWRKVETWKATVLKYSCCFAFYFAFQVSCVFETQNIKTTLSWCSRNSWPPADSTEPGFALNTAHAAMP